jgi:hypothetical protein
MDNARHAQNKPGEYQKDWVYHDDNCWCKRNDCYLEPSSPGSSNKNLG